MSTRRRSDLAAGRVGVHIAAKRSFPTCKVRQSLSQTEAEPLHLGGGGLQLHVIASPEIGDAAALVIRRGEPVLVLRDGLLAPPDLDCVRKVLGAVSVLAAVGAQMPGFN